MSLVPSENVLKITALEKSVVVLQRTSASIDPLRRSTANGSRIASYSRLVLSSFRDAERGIFSRTSMQLSPLKRLYIAGIRDGRTFRVEHAVGKAEETGKSSLGHSTKRLAHAKRKNKKSRHIGRAGVHVRIANLASCT